MKHKYIKNFWHLLPSWDSVLQDLELNLNDNSLVKIMNNLGYVTHKGERIFEVKLLMDHIAKINPNNNYVDGHIYISLLSKSETFPSHIDPLDVYYVQAHGKVLWKVYEDNIEYQYILEPSDLLYIPMGVHHQSNPLTPRIGLSIGSKPDA